jgi:hypothetical protein
MANLVEQEQEEGLGHPGVSLLEFPQESGSLSGRAGSWSWVFTVALFLVAFAGLRLLEDSPRGWLRARGESVAPATSDAGVVCWIGSAGWSEGLNVQARLSSLHAGCATDGACEYASFRATRLAERLGLSAHGEPLRLVLNLVPSGKGSSGAGEEPLVAGSVQLRNAAGVEIAVSMKEAAQGSEAADPLLRLLLRTPCELAPETSRPWLLWGTLPGKEDLSLELGIEGRSEPLRLVLSPGEVDREELPRWLGRAGEALAFAGLDRRDREIAELKQQLEEERGRRQKRELAWFDYNQALASLDWNAPVFPLAADYAPLASPVPAPEVDGEEENIDPEELRRTERAREIGRSLSALMRIEGLRALDLLEPGTLLEGAIGPVVFRILDMHGRLTGSMSAKRLRLEASRAARTLTIVLEQGSESVAGTRVPFAGGVRRILLPHVDPEDWLESVPELFSDGASPSERNDGRWHLPSVRRELNRLLALDASTGFHRLHALGGVWGSTLYGVHLEEFGVDGRLARRLFADRVRIRLGERGVFIELFDGAIVRGQGKAAFRDGVHRIYLPRAPLEEWSSATIPLVTGGAESEVLAPAKAGEG